jgi:chromosome segregation ATPase
VKVIFSILNEILHHQEKDLEISQAQYAVATAAAELADSCDSTEFAAGLTRNQLEDLAGLRRTVSSLEQEVNHLRTQNASLQGELDSLVSVRMRSGRKIMLRCLYELNCENRAKASTQTNA